MPKDELNPEDPMELFGVGLLTEEDTTAAMSECFIEEFMRLGYNHKQILALFRNPHYTGMNGVWQTKGEAFVRDAITEMFARWGRPISWPVDSGIPREKAQPCSRSEPTNHPLTHPGAHPLPLGGGEGWGERAKFTDCVSAPHGCTCSNSTH
jgi:hypothetical protein